MENGPFEDVFPIKHMDIFQPAMLVYQGFPVQETKVIKLILYSTTAFPSSQRTTFSPEKFRHVSEGLTETPWVTSPENYIFDLKRGPALKGNLR